MDPDPSEEEFTAAFFSNVDLEGEQNLVLVFDDFGLSRKYGYKIKWADWADFIVYAEEEYNAQFVQPSDYMALAVDKKNIFALHSGYIMVASLQNI